MGGDSPCDLYVRIGQDALRVIRLFFFIPALIGEHVDSRQLGGQDDQLDLDALLLINAPPVHDIAVAECQGVAFFPVEIFVYQAVLGASLGLALGFFGEIDRGNKLAGRGVLTPAARVTIDPTKQQQQQQGYRSPSTDRPGRIEADGKSWPLDEAVGIDTCVSFEPAGSLNGRPRHRTQSLVLLVLQDEALLLWWGNDYDTAEEVVAALRSAIDDELPLVAPRPQEPSQGFPPHLSMRTTSGLLVAAIMTLSIGAAVAGGNLAADALPFWVTAAIVGLFGFVPLLLIRATLWRVEAGHRLAVLQEAADQRYAELRAGRSH